MREIKFRAWDKTHSKMIINIIALNWINSVPKPVYEHWDWYKTEFELMQYTGLKDKNGKEIYEGDIILYNNSSKSTVWYKNGAFVRSYENSNEYLIYDSFINNDCLEDYKVVGNIFEDPEIVSI